MYRLLPWLTKPVNPDIARDEWLRVITLVAILCYAISICGGVLVAYLYRQRVFELLIRQSDDLFGPFAPKQTLWFSALPAVLVGVAAFLLVRTGFSSITTGESAFVASTVLLLSFVLCFVVAYCFALHWTPAKFKYRLKGD